MSNGGVGVGSVIGWRRLLGHAVPYQKRHLALLFIVGCCGLINLLLSVRNAGKDTVPSTIDIPLTEGSIVVVSVLVENNTSAVYSNATTTNRSRVYTHMDKNRYKNTTTTTKTNVTNITTTTKSSFQKEETTTNGNDTPPTPTTTTTRKNQKQQPFLILHVGPHKTGSTAIQSTLYNPEYKAILQQDDNVILFPPAEFSYFSASCLFSKSSVSASASSSNPCPLNDTTLRAMHHVVADDDSHRYDGIIYSNEAFEFAPQQFDMAKLKQYFHYSKNNNNNHEDNNNNNIHVVVVYRRFFEWLVSAHAYEYRMNYDWDHWPWVSEKLQHLNRKTLPPLVPYYLTRKRMQHKLSSRYTVKTLDYFRQQFPNNENATSIVNYHSQEDNDVVTAFCMS